MESGPAEKKMKTRTIFLDGAEKIYYSKSTMNIETLVANLENTIKGKEIYLESIGTDPSTARSFILLNIDELKKILKDAKLVQQQLVDRREKIS